MFRALLLLFSTASIALGCESNHEDRVEHLPGFNQPLPSAWYSGWLDYELEGRQVHTHYVLVEAEDNVDKGKPLIYWSNGGPGASSLFGLLTELGPLLLSDESLATDDFRWSGIPTPIYNPSTWTRLGSILIFDQPAPVGFSYCNNDTDSHSCGGIAWTDELTAENAELALGAFYDKFPCLRAADLYLTGESYGGIYIPMLARRLLENQPNVPLVGFAVGDGCLGTETDICGSLSGQTVDIWHVLFLAGHGQVPLKSLREVMKACKHNGLDFVTDDACAAAVKKVDDEAGYYYEYSLYDDCIYRNDKLGGAVNDYPCGGSPVMDVYLRMSQVKEALKVSHASFFSVDNAAGDFDYTPTEPDLRPFYQEIQGKLKVLIYNGDADPSITSLAAENWTSHLGFAETESWRPWTLDGCRRTGGYVTHYEGGFDFLTIRGAGHMVPTYKSEATFVFLKAWIEGKDYPAYDKTCERPALVDGGVATG